MAPFSIPAPSIVPLRMLNFGGPRSIDTETLIQLHCGTKHEFEAFFTLDGTKPQPYAGIVQGSKLYKYRRPFRLPPGKITIKAIALSSIIPSMRSNVVTKTFEVLPSETGSSKKKKKRQSCVKPCKDGAGTVVKHDKERNLCDELDALNMRDFDRDDVCCGIIFEESVEELSDASPEEPLESSNEDTSIASVKEVFQTPRTGDSFLFASAQATDTYELHTQDRAFISDSTRENDSSEEGSNSMIDKFNESKDKESYCRKCEALLQHCISCSALSAISSKFCIQCGTRLLRECQHCKELNSVIASFCQSCGRKIETDDLRSEDRQVRFLDSCVMAEPQTNHASVQQSLPLDNKQTQTPFVQKNRKGSPKIRLPPHSPGQGYWRQQIDYVCNHLKSYAYNNAKFRESISEPMLSEFQSVEVVRTEDKVSITVSFSSIENGKDVKN